jgi:hypothetical protein
LKHPKNVRAFRQGLGDAGYDHAAIRMAAKDNVRRFLATHDTDNVLDVGAEINGVAHQMGALAEPGQGRR